jgi:hypothetical protein
MPRGSKPGECRGGRKFLPGQSGNPAGREPTVLTRQFLQYNRETINNALAKIIGMTFPEVKEEYDKDENTVLEKMIMSIIIKAIEEGCHTRFGMLLDRLIGKVRDAPPIFGLPQTHINDPEELKKIDTEKAIVYEVLMTEAGKFQRPRPQLVGNNDQ